VRCVAINAATLVDNGVNAANKAMDKVNETVGQVRKLNDIMVVDEVVDGVDETVGQARNDINVAVDEVVDEANETVTPEK
jgi:hypothetical protein